MTKILFKTLKLTLFSTLPFLGIPSVEAASLTTNAVIKSMGANTIEERPSSAKGYQAILAEKDGKRRIFYETPNGEYVFYGVILDKNGNNVTAIDAINFAAPAQVPSVVAPVKPLAIKPEVKSTLLKSDDSVSQSVSNKAAWNVAKNAYGLKEGKGKPVYVVFDPNCSFCKSLHSKTRQYLGSSEIHWIPVAALNENSAYKAAKLITLNDATQIPLVSAGGVQVSEPNEDETKKLRANYEVMNIAKATSIPLIVYQNKSGETFTRAAVPSDEEINIIFGK